MWLEDNSTLMRLALRLEQETKTNHCSLHRTKNMQVQVLNFKVCTCDGCLLAGCRTMGWCASAVPSPAACAASLERRRCCCFCFLVCSFGCCCCCCCGSLRRRAKVLSPGASRDNDAGGSDVCSLVVDAKNTTAAAAAGLAAIAAGGTNDCGLGASQPVHVAGDGCPNGRLPG